VTVSDEVQRSECAQAASEIPDVLVVKRLSTTAEIHHPTREGRVRPPRAPSEIRLPTLRTGTEDSKFAQVILCKMDD
jgi:hypothetical protein